jgi:hypothetical protein
MRRRLIDSKHNKAKAKPQANAKPAASLQGKVTSRNSAGQGGGPSKQTELTEGAQTFYDEPPAGIEAVVTRFTNQRLPFHYWIV